MFSFNAQSPHNSRRPLARLVRWGLLCLAAAFLVLGCPSPAGGGGDGGGTIPPSLIGTWTSAFGEKWIITSSSVQEASGFDTDFTGTIQNNPQFSQSAGVIILKYTTKKPQYYDYEGGIQTGGPFPPPGDYMALYWKTLSSGTVELGKPWNLSDFSHNGAPEKGTVQEAISAFTLDKSSTYVGTYSACTRQ